MYCVIRYTNTRRLLLLSLLHLRLRGLDTIKLGHNKRVLRLFFTASAQKRLTALIHDIITHQRLDLLAVTETWMKTSHPAAITHGIAPVGYRVLHRHRDNVDDGGGVALVYSDQLQFSTVPLSSTVTGVDCLVSSLSTRRLNVAVVYRPPSSFKHGVCVTVLQRVQRTAR